VSKPSRKSLSVKSLSDRTAASCGGTPLDAVQLPKFAMNKEFIALLLSGTVIVSAGAGVAAQAASPAPSTPTSATTLRVRGTIDKYDRLTRMLVLSTPTGTLQFPVASTTRIRQGWHRVIPLDLPALAGDADGSLHRIERRQGRRVGSRSANDEA
jgi:hypothetical protein